MDLERCLKDLASDDSHRRENIIERCERANFRWEQAVSPARSQEYHGYVGDVASYKEWKAEHNGFVNTFVHIPCDFPRSSETFMAVNQLAHLREDLDDTFLLRLESLERITTHPLTRDLAESFWQRFYRSQSDLDKSRLPDAAAQLRNEFVTQMNEFRLQARPMFATFLNEFGGNLKQLKAQDWPHLLRDRLGLTHWTGIPDKPLPVALMCYSVAEVRESRLLASKKGAVASFSRPTILDAAMSSAFIPAPRSDQGRGITRRS